MVGNQMLLGALLMFVFAAGLFVADNKSSRITIQDCVSRPVLPH